MKTKYEFEMNYVTYLLKVKNRNTRTRCELSLKLTPCSSVSIVNFEHIIAGWVNNLNLEFLRNLLKVLKTKKS